MPKLWSRITVSLVYWKTRYWVFDSVQRSVQNNPEVHFPQKLLASLDRTGLTFPIERPLSFQHLLQIILTEKGNRLGGECQIITVTRTSILFKTWAPNQQALICKLQMLDRSSVKTTVSPQKVKSYSSFISLMPCLYVFSLCFKSTLYWLEKGSVNLQLIPLSRGFPRRRNTEAAPPHSANNNHSEYFVKEPSESTTNLWNRTAALVQRALGPKSLLNKTLLAESSVRTGQCHVLLSKT